jgi:hypothetical protein
MEWIQRNPKAAIGVSALAVLCVVILVWGMSGGSGTSSAEPTLAPLATPTATPSHKLTVLPSPTVAPTGKATSISDVLNGFPSTGMGEIPPGMLGSGGDYGLPPHRVVISAGSDGPLLGVGWKIPTADGKRGGKDLSYKKSFSHATTAYGRPDYAQLYTRVGPDSSRVWCTVRVDGVVTEHEEGHGPWSAVFCQG